MSIAYMQFVLLQASYLEEVLVQTPALSRWPQVVPSDLNDSVMCISGVPTSLHWLQKEVRKLARI